MGDPLSHHHMTTVRTPISHLYNGENVCANLTSLDGNGVTSLTSFANICDFTMAGFGNLQWLYDGKMLKYEPCQTLTIAKTLASIAIAGWSSLVARWAHNQMKPQSKPRLQNTTTVSPSDQHPRMTRVFSHSRLRRA